MCQYEIDPLRSECIRLGIREFGHVHIPHDILRLVHTVQRPILRRLGSTSIIIRVQVVDKRRPAVAHEIGQLNVRVRFAQEGVRFTGLVEAVAVDVAENEGDFLGMGHAFVPRGAGRNGVEAVAVGIDTILGL